MKIGAYFCKLFSKFSYNLNNNIQKHKKYGKEN